eukprot:23550-Eustigmatos_ZCMA.PRE.1
MARNCVGRYRTKGSAEWQVGVSSDWLDSGGGNCGIMLVLVLVIVVETEAQVRERARDTQQGLARLSPLVER